MHALSPAPATGYLDRKRRHPALLTTAIVLHAGLLAAILSYNPEIIGGPPEPIEFINVTPPVPPPPIPEKQKPAEQPARQTPQQIDRPTLPIPLPPIAESWPVLPPQPPLPHLGGTGGGIAKAEPAPPVITIAELDPRYRGDVQPPYPPSLERMEVEGKVTVRLQVGPDGRVTSVELIRADDPGFFATTRDWAMKRWRFKPATRDGVAVASTVIKTVSFRIVRA